MPNPWIEHVRNYARVHNISYGCAISEAKASYIKTPAPKKERKTPAPKKERKTPAPEEEVALVRTRLKWESEPPPKGELKMSKRELDELISRAQDLLSDDVKENINNIASVLKRKQDFFIRKYKATKDIRYIEYANEILISGKKAKEVFTTLSIDNSDEDNADIIERAYLIIKRALATAEEAQKALRPSRKSKKTPLPEYAD